MLKYSKEFLRFFSLKKAGDVRYVFLLFDISITSLTEREPIQGDDLLTSTRHLFSTTSGGEKSKVSPQTSEMGPKCARVTS